MTGIGIRFRASTIMPCAEVYMVTVMNFLLLSQYVDCGALAYIYYVTTSSVFVCHVLIGTFILLHFLGLV